MPINMFLTVKYVGETMQGNTFTALIWFISTDKKKKDLEPLS